MAIIGNIAIGMSVGTSGLTKGLGAAQSAIGGFAGSLMSVQGLLAGLAGSAAVAGIYKMASASARLGEEIAKTQAVFGTQAQAAEDSARALSQAYGMSLTDVLGKQAQFGAMFKGLGYTDEAAQNYSDVMTRLANDMTRRWDVEGGVGEAMERLMSGLRGAPDALEKFGVSFTSATVQVRAYQMGLAKVGQELSEGAKKQALANIIMEQMKSSIGAAADEAGSFGANAAALSGRWENLTTTIGETFAPVIGAALGEVGTLLEALRIGWVNNRESATNWAAQSLDASGGVIQGLSGVTTALGYAVDAWQVLTLTIRSGQVYILQGMMKVLDVAYGFTEIWESITGARLGVEERILTYMDSVNADLAELRAEWNKDWKAPWASEELVKNVEAAKANLKSLQDQLAAKPMDLMAVTGAKGTADKLYKSSRPFGEALKLGSAEAQKAMARAQFGGADAVAKNTKATADAAKESVVVQKEMRTSLQAFVDKYQAPAVFSF